MLDPIKVEEVTEARLEEVIDKYLEEIKIQVAYYAMYGDRLCDIMDADKVFPWIGYDFTAEIGNRPFDISEYFKDIRSLTLKYFKEARELYIAITKGMLNSTEYNVILHNMQQLKETAEKKSIPVEIISTGAINWVDNYFAVLDD